MLNHTKDYLFRIGGDEFAATIADMPREHGHALEELYGFAALYLVKEQGRCGSRGYEPAEA